MFFLKWVIKSKKLDGIYARNEWELIRETEFLTEQQEENFLFTWNLLKINLKIIWVTLKESVAKEDKEKI